MIRMNINLFLSAGICAVFLSACTSDSLPDIGQGFQSESLQAPWHGKTDRTRFSCHSSEDRFFFSFEVEDSTFVLAGYTGQSCQEDSFGGVDERVVDGEDRVEVFFSPDKSLKNGYYCAEIDAAGRIMDYRAVYFRNFDFAWNFKTMKAEGMVTPWGYRVCGSVSREELESLGIALEKGFWFGAFRGDRLGGIDHCGCGCGKSGGGDCEGEDGGEIHCEVNSKGSEEAVFEWYSLIPVDVEEPDFHVPGVLFECRATPKKERHGVVVYPDDITSLGLTEWEKRIDLSGIDVIGLHAATSNDPVDTLEAFILSSQGRDFLALCQRKGVDVEYELHSLESLLPRELFDEHPEYFRVDENGERIRDYNMCFSNEDAIEAMRPQLEKLLEWVKPTTNRYYFWADDKQGKFCHCENCASFSPSEQILLYENRLLALLREYDPEATLAHLAYQQTESAPKALRADSGIFLEYAPIKRDYNYPLSQEQTAALKENLMTFPAHTQHILEYWLDESMFSRWKKTQPVLLPFKQEQAERDIAQYRELGAADFTCFATWLNARYSREFGSTDGIFRSYGAAFGQSTASTSEDLRTE